MEDLQASSRFLIAFILFLVFLVTRAFSLLAHSVALERLSVPRKQKYEDISSMLLGGTLNPVTVSLEPAP